MFAFVIKGWWDTHVYAGIHQGSEIDVYVNKSLKKYEWRNDG